MGIGDRITTAANIKVSVARFARFLRSKEIQNPSDFIDENS